MWTLICLFTLYTKPNVVASIFKKQYNINEAIVNRKKLYDSFKGYLEKTKIPMSKMLYEAIEDYLKKHEIKY